MAGIRLPFLGSATGGKATSKGGSDMKKKSGEKGVTLIAANTEVSGDVHFVNQLYRSAPIS